MASFLVRTVYCRSRDFATKTFVFCFLHSLEHRYSGPALKVHPHLQINLLLLDLIQRRIRGCVGSGSPSPQSHTNFRSNHCLGVCHHAWEFCKNLLFKRLVLLTLLEAILARCCQATDLNPFRNKF